MFIFKTLSRATDLKIHKLNHYEYGWKKCNISGEPVPIWDSSQNVDNVELLLKTTLAKCGCKKNMCKTRQCSCMRRNLRKCSVLCTCINCKLEETLNITSGNSDKIKSAHEEHFESDESTENSSSDEYDEDKQDLYVEHDKYYDSEDSDREYIDQEENTLM